MHPATRSATWAAWSALALGLTVSMAGNVAHTLTLPHPSTGAVIASVIWPVLLLLAIELLRFPWPDGRRYLLARVCGVGPVGLVSGLVSYRHLSGLLAHYGEDPVVCAVGPLAVDGIMAMATAAILSRHATATVAAPVVDAPAPTVTEDDTTEPATTDTRDATRDEHATTGTVVAPVAPVLTLAPPAKPATPYRDTRPATPAKTATTRPATSRDALADTIHATGGTARDLMAALAADGDDVSLRTCQRLIAAAKNRATDGVAA